MNSTRNLFASNCAGRGCRKKGVNLLQIKFLHKKGVFCKQCSEMLVYLDLVEDFSDTNADWIKKMDDEDINERSSRHCIEYSHPHGGGKQIV